MLYRKHSTGEFIIYLLRKISMFFYTRVTCKLSSVKMFGKEFTVLKSSVRVKLIHSISDYKY